MQWIVEEGGSVYLPFGHSPDVDLVADLDGELLRVQVKTSRRMTPYGNYQVMLETKGGNQSWNGVVRHFDAGRCDRLFVLVGNGRRWFIPSDAIEARTSICLGGSKYSEWEVEPGRAFADEADIAR